MTLSDLDTRVRALRDLDSNFIVEAAAGTGKTSLIAGRVAMMLAEGRDPASIAAITFTELAASQLEQKIRLTVEQLRAGKVPPALEALLPAEGLDNNRRAALDQVAPRIDELTATTIHGFCQTIISMHGVEAGLDPGARVIDAATADSMFSEALSAWLTLRLGADDSADDPVAVLSKDDPLYLVEEIRKLAELKRKHPDARANVPDFAERVDLDFVDAVQDFARWHAASPGEPSTADLIGELEALARFFDGCLGQRRPFAELWAYAHPPRNALKKKRLDLVPYRRIGAWRQAHGQDAGTRLGHEAETHFARVERSYQTLLGRIAQALTASLSEALDDLIEVYTRRKRDAAVLDFDDLLQFAHALVCGRETVRVAVANRYQSLLVDEFQDTDRLQAEIIFSIAAQHAPRVWHEAEIRPGALFLVGDPKQAIYRFRGADVEAYALARDVMTRQGNGELLNVTANFRSKAGIISHVNSTFANVLSAPGQPGYVALTETPQEASHDLDQAARLTVSIELPDPRAEDLREAEAEAVAGLCKRLIGSLMIRGEHNILRPLRAGDIALLAPTSADLWRYERALEKQKISVSSQAGQALFHRQETQDILALARTLADRFDTLAFGALMRGPLVGLTDEELLDITASLPSRPDGKRAFFTVATDPDHVAHPLARAVLQQLQGLRRLSTQTTPVQLLTLAVERLQLKVIVAARHGNRNARALANIDTILQMARAYAVSGLKAFVRDLQDGWERKRRTSEGRVDSSEDSVEVVTMHSAKGLEWSVVIPINASTRFRPDDAFVYRQSDNTLHWMIGGVEPPDLAQARAEEAIRETRQRERLWYVACTRPREMLIIPNLPGAPPVSWTRVMDLGQARLPEFDGDSLPALQPQERPAAMNEQSSEAFEAEGQRVRNAAPAIRWRRPSERDAERAGDLVETFVIPAIEDGAFIPSGAGPLRGAVLHKLMEEFLTGELPQDESAALDRATVLIDQLSAGITQVEAQALPDPRELARTAVGTLNLSELRSLRDYLVPEVSIWSTSGEVYLAGQSDALAVRDGRIQAILDWKSDINPSPDVQLAYVGQLSDYLEATGTRQGAIVYMTHGQVAWVERPAGPGARVQD